MKGSYSILMTAVKISSALLVIASGAAFILLLAHYSYSLPVSLAAFLLDLSMLITILVYKIQIDSDGKFQRTEDPFLTIKNTKRLSVIKNVSIVLTAVFLLTNCKTFFIPVSYNSTNLITIRRTSWGDADSDFYIFRRNICFWL